MKSTTTLTTADFCQGHGGGRDCDYSPETGGCVHGDDFDHGIVSYCDGSCAEGRDAWCEYLEENPHLMPVSSDDKIVLDAHYYTQGVSYRVIFEGPDAEAWALAYIAARPHIYFDSATHRPWSASTFPALHDALHPTCHHGLAADLCMDPYGDYHFGTRDQELASGR